jgi:putative ABC transport system permease protein
MRRRKRMLEELSEDIQEHIDRETQDNIERGMPPEEARQAARRKFGNVTRVMEDTREVWTVVWLETLLQDLRFAFRMLRKNPGFTAVVALTLALGIGANTAIFSVVYAVLLKPIPYTQAGEVFNIFQQHPPDPSGQPWAYLNLEELREQNHVLAAVGGASRHQLTLTGRGEPLVVNTAVVTGDFFSLFDAKPLLGRVLYPEDAKAGAPPVVILSENLWRSLGADPNIVGSAVDLDERSFTVVGVMPAAFRLPLFPGVTEPPHIWIPVIQDPLFGPWMQRRGLHFLQATARLKPGVSMSQVQAEMGGLAERLAKEFPAENKDWSIHEEPLQEMIVENVKSALFMLLGAVGLVLLIACANIANLLLARGTSRAREIAVRATLGASRGRIVRQLLSESVLLGLLGGLAGIALAFWGVHVLVGLIPAEVPIVNAIRVDYSVLFFALTLSVVASIGFGLAPVFLAANSDPQVHLRESSARSGESSGGRRARNVLATAEIALAMMLLVAAGLLLRSFAKLTAVNPGFQVQHMAIAEVDLPRTRYATPQLWVSFSEELLRNLQSEPGLTAAALTVPAPLEYQSCTMPFDIVGRPPSSTSTSRIGDYVSVSTNYFRTVGIPLLAGRLFDERDVMSAPNVTVISKALARVYFPNEDPLGKQLSFAFPPAPGVPRQIVGIVGDVHDASLGEEPRPMMYVPFAQAPFPGAVLMLKSPLSLSSVTATLRQDVAKIDKDLPVSHLAAMPDVLSTSLAQPRFRTLLLSLFAAMAVVLAATGIFGVISYSVSRRTNEIGIRVALGASRGAILRLVSRETFTLVFTGLLLGAAGALAASRLIGHLLFGVSASDPFTLVSVALVLALVAALAAYVPARRAMRVDPLVALRHE